MEPTRIIVVEDEHIVALDIKMHLLRYGYEVPALFASGEALLEKIDELKPDLVLMDIKLQGKLDGVETSKIVKEKYGVPVILLTAFADDTTIERAKTIEPFGYIIKPFEEKELRSTIVIALYKHQMEARLRSREELFATTLSSIGDAVFVFDDNGRLEYANSVAAKLTGRDLQDVQGKPLEEVLYLTDGAQEGLHDRFPEACCLEHKGGRLVVEKTSSPLVSDRGERNGTVLVIRDISERFAADKALLEREEQLRQSQKMEAIGRLAGGIAHDFNNLLTVIMGYSKLILEDHETNATVRSNIEGIQHATLKSVNLTRQLLTFSRRQSMEMKTLDLHRLISDMEKMIRRLTSEESSVTFSLEASHPFIHVDHGHIEQVLINLVVNARDAMSGSGSLVVRTSNTTIERGFPTFMGEIPPGSYVTLSVRDFGAGIDPETLKKIFDPFFTTKESGKGTGLGLATVYSIVQQSSGYITVESTLRKGTTFCLYFPLQTRPSEIEVEAEPADANLSGAETILVVEDEAQVRSLMVSVLDKLGYHVVDTPNAGEALLICEEYPNTIHLLVTDIILPHVNGSRLARRLTQIRKDLKVLYISGYPLNMLKEKKLIDDGDEFMQKPFKLEELALRVRRILDA